MREAMAENFISSTRNQRPEPDNCTQCLSTRTPLEFVSLPIKNAWPWPMPPWPKLISRSTTVPSEFVCCCSCAVGGVKNSVQICSFEESERPHALGGLICSRMIRSWENPDFLKWYHKSIRESP